AKDFRRSAKEKNNALFLKVDKELNDLTIRAAKNEYAAAAMTTLHGMSRRFWFGNFNQEVSISSIAVLHATLADEIAAGHEEAAGQALDKLLDYIEDFTRRTVLPDH
ncbi:MAG: FCD domain-containing protein, partial [Burkholderiaceae bacterium]